MNVRVAAWTEGVRWGDFVELTKPRITSMVVLTTALGSFLANPRPFPLLVLMHNLLGVALLAGGAQALNQYLEREADGRMRRTVQRPLPAGRLEPRQALWFGIGLSAAGLVYLATLVNLLTALLGVLTLTSYLFVYTPLKSKTPAALLVGAVPGALPPVLGWTAMVNRLDGGAWILFGVLFFWQLPHFLAIAWLYREDYRRGGFAVLALRDPAGVKTARQIVLGTLALMAVTMVPWVAGLSGTLYGVGALLLGLAFLSPCVAFALSHSMRSARWVMLASVLYLPAVLAVMVLDRLV